MIREAGNAILDSGCEALNIVLSEDQKNTLLRYVVLLEKWNKAYNLTAVRDSEEMISRHILDSLSILPSIQGETLLDVGTGAGLPGIPLAIAHPVLAVTLLDSNSKKTRFLQQAKAELGLDNVMVVHGRVEQVELAQQFETVTARAFASMEEVAALAGRHCQPAGCLLLMMGQAPSNTEMPLEGEFLVTDVMGLQVPETDGERHVVRLRREL